jgi:hypothetical protein
VVIGVQRQALAAAWLAEVHLRGWMHPGLFVVAVVLSQPVCLWLVVSLPLVSP